jgi:excisionase family DNA binding protein
MRSESVPELSPPKSIASRLIDVQEVAELLGVCERTVWRRVEDGDIPQPIYIGRLAKWRLGDIEEFISQKFHEANSKAHSLSRGRSRRRMR